MAIHRAERTPFVPVRAVSIDHDARLRAIASEGRPGAPTIVLLHGFGGCAALWKPVAKGLRGDARTIAYDLPGHGGSLSWPEPVSARIAAEAILTDLRHRGEDRVHVAGHSMGGAVAILMALSAPTRIASLTLLAPGGIGSEINDPLLRRYAAAASENEIEACLASMSGAGKAVPPAAVRALKEMRSAAGQTARLVSLAAAITRGDRQGVIPNERLASLAMPVTVLWGTGDSVLPSDQARRLPPHFAIDLLPGLGHMLIEEAPDRVADTLRSAIG